MSCLQLAKPVITGSSPPWDKSLPRANWGYYIARVSSDPIIVKTPTAVQCSIAFLEWTGGVPDYLAEVDSGGRAVATFQRGPGRSLIWDVILKEGSVAIVKITDADGNVGLSDPFVIQPSNDSSCLEF